MLLRRKKTTAVLVLMPMLVLAATVALILQGGTVATGEGALPRGPEAAAVESPLDVPDSKAELGRLLFFDPRLSGDATVSCSTCHMPGKAWTDGKPLSRGYTNTEYFRNTPTLLNAGEMAFLDWDGRFSSGQLRPVVRDHFHEAHFMQSDGRLIVERVRQVPEYEEGFKAVFGSEPSHGKLRTALAEFVKTLESSPDHPFLQFLDGEEEALSDQARRGYALFQGKARCSQCHEGRLLSDGEFHALGVAENPAIFDEPLRHITFRRFFRQFGIGEYVTMREDPGRYAMTKQEEDWGKFRTPSLLEVARTAPYMHNGTLGSLDDVVRFYNQGGGESPNTSPLLEPLGLSEQEVADLVVFLESLGSEESGFQKPKVPEYQLRKLGKN